MHCAFMFLRKQLTQSFDPAAWNSASPQHYVMEYSTFLGNRNFERFEPSDPGSLKLYRRFVVNAFRTSLYLLLDETRRTHVSGLQSPVLEEAKQMVEYISSQDPQSKKQMWSLLEQIDTAVIASKQLYG